MLFFSNLRGRYDEVEGFTIFDLLFDTIEPIFLCQVGPNSRRSLVYSLSDALDLGVYIFFGRLDLFELRYPVHYECPADRFLGALALGLADRLPIDLQLGRIGIMLGHLTSKALEESVHLLLDHYERHVEPVQVEQVIPRCRLQLPGAALRRVPLEIGPDVGL